MMNQSNSAFRKKTATRIASVSILLSIIAGVTSWYFAKESYEKSIVLLGYEEAHRAVSMFSDPQNQDASADNIAQKVTTSLIGGIFDIAEIYDTNTNKLEEAMTPAGKIVEDQIPKHSYVDTHSDQYQSYHLENNVWILRIFVPLNNIPQPTNIAQLGYFEGVRVVPDWQKEQIRTTSMIVSLLVAAAALCCGLIIYPIVIHLTKENERKTLEVLDSHISMMEALGRAIAKRDSDTGIHNYRVAWIAARIGEKMGLKGAQMQSLIAGSFLHDVGKIGIQDSILLKPGKLTTEEFSIMKTHVNQGIDIVHGMGWLQGAGEVVASHHEKWNGTGYPLGLKENDIPLSARIFAIADVYDALSSKRPYKDSMPFDKVMTILADDTGTHFDRTIMAIFIPMAEEIKQTLSGLNEEQVRELLQKMIHRHFYVTE